MNLQRKGLLSCVSPEMSARQSRCQDSFTRILDKAGSLEALFDFRKGPSDFEIQFPDL